MTILIIAEAGVNHNGDINLAKKLIDAAVEAGADLIKFQTFKANNLTTKNAPKSQYQNKTTSENETQYEMLKNLELTKETHNKLIDYCNEKKIGFFSSGFDIESIDFLNSLGLKMFKIPSGEITNLPYLRHVGSFGKPVILSSGMSTLKEIKEALEVLEFSGVSKDKITVLHCNTEYPTPLEDVNLRAMITIRDSLGVNIGYSDHTSGIEVSIAAAAIGAKVIEKHFTIDRELPGPDHKASLEPLELKQMIRSIRNIEIALGNIEKKPSPSELKNIPIARKSIVAKKKILVGEVLTINNITVKRPGNGISPMDWDKVLGQVAKKNFLKDELITI